MNSTVRANPAQHTRSNVSFHSSMNFLWRHFSINTKSRMKSHKITFHVNFEMTIDKKSDGLILFTWTYHSVCTIRKKNKFVTNWWSTFASFSCFDHCGWMIAGYHSEVCTWDSSQHHHWFCRWSKDEVKTKLTAEMIITKLIQLCQKLKMNTAVFPTFSWPLKTVWINAANWWTCWSCRRYWQYK